MRNFSDYAVLVLILDKSRLRLHLMGLEKSAKTSSLNFSYGTSLPGHCPDAIYEKSYYLLFHKILAGRDPKCRADFSLDFLYKELWVDLLFKI